MSHYWFNRQELLHIKMFKKKKAKNKYRNLSEEEENAAEIDTKT